MLSILTFASDKTIMQDFSELAPAFCKPCAQRPAAMFNTFVQQTYNPAFSIGNKQRMGSTHVYKTIKHVVIIVL